MIPLKVPPKPCITISQRQISISSRLRSIYASKYQIRAMFDLKTKKKKKNKIRFKIYLIKIYNLEI